MAGVLRPPTLFIYIGAVPGSRTRLVALVVAALMAAAPGRASAQTRLTDAGRGPAESGWALAASRLFVTSDAGRSWADATPPAHSLTTASADFSPDGALWLASIASDGVRAFVSTDAGGSWTSSSLPPFSFEPGAVTVAARTAREAWLLVERASNANFSDGALFSTADAGASWQRLGPVPAAGLLALTPSGEAMLVGGPSGREVHVTTDAGASWRPALLPASWDRDEVWLARPVFTGDEWLVAATGADQRGQALVSLRWTIDGQRLDPREQARWAAAVSAASTSRDGADVAGRLARNARGGGRARGLSVAGGTAAAFDAPATGEPWVMTRRGTCEEGKQQCTEVTTLWLAGADGPIDVTPGPPAATAVAIAPRDVATSGNRGFDKCTAASVASLQAWWHESPYRDVNIYIGGISRGCSQPLLTAGWVRDVFAQGWTLIPTWVGYQAPCTSCTSCRNRFSLDTIEADAEGAREADRASEAAAGLGLAGQTVVYLDIEAYASNDRACRDAVSAFVNGWGRRMRERGNVAGVYGSATNASQDWTGITHRPDAVWIGKWDQRDTVWGLTPLSDAEWANHQRIHQYRGGHDETWGGITFNIDNDVEDGPVAVPAGVSTSDVTPPDLVVESPAPDAVVTAPVIQVRGTASDAERGDSGIARVLVNGVEANGGAAAGRDVASWRADITLGTGTHEITIEAADASAARNITRRVVRVTVTTAPGEPAPDPPPMPSPAPTLPSSPTPLASGLTDPRGLWLDAAAVYWIDSTGVLAHTPLVERAESVRIDETLVSPTAMTGDARALYVADARGLWRYERIDAASRTFAPPTLLTSETGEATSLIVVDDVLVWTERTSGQVRRIHLATRDVAIVASSASPTSLRRSGERLVWVDAVPRGAVWGSDLAGADVRRLAEGTNTPGAIVDGDRVLWAQMDDEGESGRLRAVSIEGGDAWTLVDGLRRPWAVAAADGAIYWVESLPEGTVWRANADGSAAARAATNAAEPTVLAVNDRALVWIERGGGEARRGRLLGMSPVPTPATTAGAARSVAR
jgi:hypothetical protein